MSTGAVIGIVVAVVVVIVVIAALAMSRGATGTGRLKHRFGPEYDRALAQHDGDDKATRKELAERVKRYGDLERRPLSEADRECYTARWQEIQAHFVEEPGRALNEADRLIGEVAADRGFPAAGSPEHFDALSVHQAYDVQGYRQAHALAEHAGAGGQGGTEDMRKALVNARSLFAELLTAEGKSHGRKGAEDTAGSDDARTGEAPADDVRTDDGLRADDDVRTGGGATVPRQRTEDDTMEQPATDGTDRTDHTDPSDTDAETDAEAEPAHHSLGRRFAALTGSGQHKNEDRGSDRT